ncbi:NaeI family type II restriction endonuclease [Streptomyces sp. PA03-3a]|nr:NaeI family type II restriction endonuclease [Streptomyces sp. PA03-3a]
MSSIVVLLREVIDESGIGLRGLAEKLKAEPWEGPRFPGYQTLSKRLKGIGLQNEPRLIYAIIAICTEEGRQEQVRERVAELLADARGAAVTAGGTPRKQSIATDRQLVDALAEINTLHKKMERLRRRAERAENRLTKARELLAAGSRDTSVHPSPPKRTVGRSGTSDTIAPQQIAAVGRVRRETPAAPTAPGLLRWKDSASAEEVITFLNAVPDLQRRTASSLREAFDSVLDGERTGRYDLARLHKAEKTYLSSRIEHFLGQAWGLRKRTVDSRLRDVPLRFTWTSTWMLRPEHVGRVCLLVRASDSKSRWSLGVLAVAPEHLSLTSNRDGAAALSVAGRNAVHWLFEDAVLPGNVLLHLDQRTLARVFSPMDDVAADHAQGRTNNLFRVVQGQLLDRSAVRTVAMDPDSPKRVREARRNLLTEGIFVLGHHGDQPRIATALGLPQPNKGEWVSVRVVRRQPSDGEAPSVEIDGEEWRIAAPDDPIESAPYVY